MVKKQNSEYTFLRQTIKDISVIYGGSLVVWSALISYVSSSQSFTSWIPAFLGIPILILGLISIIYPKMQKLCMHVVVLLGLLCFLGGLDLVRNFWSSLAYAAPFPNSFVWSSKLMLLISGFVFCYLCIKSFLHIRKTKSLTSTDN